MTQPRASRSKPLRRPDAWLLVALAALPVVTMLALVLRYGVDVPFWDEWDLAGRLGELRAGHGTVEPLTRSHNEHRLFFPLSVLALVAWLTSWNVRWQLAVNVLVLTLGLPALLRLARSSLQHRPAVAAIFLFGTGLLFHPAAVENWTWSWQLQIFALVVATLWTLELLARQPERTRDLAAAIATAFVATFSFANGLLLWPLGLLVLGLPGRETRWRRAVVWLVAAIPSVGLFFAGRAIEPRGGGASLESIALYACTWLGSPFWGRIERPGVAAVLGLAGLVVAAGLVLTAGEAWRRPAWRAALALSSFAALSALLTASGRAAYGQEQALASRYVTVSSLFWIGLALLLAQRWEATRSRDRRRAHGVLALALSLVSVAVVGLALRLPADLEQFVGQELHRAWLRAELRRGVLSEAAASALYPRRERLERFLALACRERLSVFRAHGTKEPLDCDFSPGRSAPERQLWRLEEEAGTPALRSQRGYRLPVHPGLQGELRRAAASPERCWAGWAWDPGFDESVAGLVLLIDGASQPVTLRRPSRPARAAAEGDPGLEASGVRLCLGEPATGDVRVFAVSRRGGYASELTLEAGVER